MKKFYLVPFFLWLLVCSPIAGFHRSRLVDPYTPHHRIRMAILGLGGVIPLVVFSGAAGYVSAMINPGPKGDKGDAGKDFVRETSKEVMEISLTPPHGGIGAPSIYAEVFDPDDRVIEAVEIFTGKFRAITLCSLGGRWNPCPVGMYKIVFWVREEGTSLSDFGSITIYTDHSGPHIIATPAVGGQAVQYTIYVDYPGGQVSFF